MNDYRIYNLNAAGHIVWGQDIKCATDEDALAEARIGLRVAEQVEVWSGARRVGLVTVKLSQTG